MLRFPDHLPLHLDLDLLEGLVKTVSPDQLHVWEVVLCLAMLMCITYGKGFSCNRVYMEKGRRTTPTADEAKLKLSLVHLVNNSPLAVAAAAALSRLSPQHLQQMVASLDAHAIRARVSAATDVIIHHAGESSSELLEWWHSCRAADTHAPFCEESKEVCAEADADRGAEQGVAAASPDKACDAPTCDGGDFSASGRVCTGAIDHALLSCPQDVTLQILAYVQLQDALQLAQTCRHARRICEGDDVWRLRWLARFGAMWESPRMQSLLARRNLHGILKPSTVAPPGGQTWKEFYFRFEASWVNWVVAGSNTEGCCWVGLHGCVYDLTEFLPSHPGTKETILVNAGTDATPFFEDVCHSHHARSMMQAFLILAPVRADSRCALHSVNKRLEELRALITDDAADQHETTSEKIVLALAPRLRGLAFNTFDNDEEEEEEEGDADDTENADVTLYDLFPSGGHAREKCCTHEGVRRMVYDPFRARWVQWWTCCGLAQLD